MGCFSVFRHSNFLNRSGFYLPHVEVTWFLKGLGSIRKNEGYISNLTIKQPFKYLIFPPFQGRNKCINIKEVNVYQLYFKNVCVFVCMLVYW